MRLMVQGAQVLLGAEGRVLLRAGMGGAGGEIRYEREPSGSLLGCCIQVMGGPARMAALRDHNASALSWSPCGISERIFSWNSW